MMEILGVSAGGSPLKNHTDFSHSALSETAKVGFLMVPDTYEHTSADATSAARAREPTEGSQTGAGEKETTGDLDSTGDSDRLVIADEDTDNEQESDCKPVVQEVAKVPQNTEVPVRAEDVTRVEDIAPREVPATETVAEPEVDTSRPVAGVSELTTHEQQQPLETDKCETVSDDVAQTKEPQTEAPHNITTNTTTTTATAQAPDTTARTAESPCPEPESLRNTLEETSDKTVVPTVESEVENKAPVLDAQDVDSQSNASTDSGRDHTVPQTAEKKRRRRKPIKVSKHEPEPEEKYDNNFNSVEVVPPPPTAAPKPVAGLMNSFVAKAMKLWYDEELPKTLTSSPTKMTPDLKAELVKRMEFEKMNAFMKEQLMREQQEAKSGVHVKSEPAEQRSGVAPDDQYYSTPSPATPDSRPMGGGVQEYWTPGRCYMPNPTGGEHPPDGVSVGGTPLVAKAMQSLSCPSPAVSPSLGSDQESPAAGPKRYICSLCNKSFTFRTNLTRHQRAFHGRPCRRRTHDVGGKEESEAPRAHSVSSEDVDHMSDHRDFTEEKLIMPKSEPHMDPRYGRFSPSIVSEAKAGRFSPSMPSPSASSSSEPLSVPKSTTPTLPPYSTTHSPCQDFVVIPPREPVSCSLCLTTFDSQPELNRHEATCRGIDRSKLQSDSFGAIDLSKPKVCKVLKQEPAESSDSERETHVTYKPKFHYNMAEMMKPSVTPPTHEAPLAAAPFLPTPGGLQALLPHHLAASGLLPHQLTSGLPLPFSPNGPGKRPYRCTLCTKKYSSFTSLAKHVGFVHKINLMALQQQQQQQQQQQVGQDSMAAMVAMANAEMNMLVEQEAGRLHRNAGGDGLGQFPCKICGHNFSFATHLRAHYHTVHLGVKEPSGRDSASPDMMRGMVPGGKTSEWVCDVCGQNFASKRNLNRHLSHVHKLDRKKEPHTQDGRSTTPVEKKPFVPVVPTYPHPPAGHPALNLAAPKNEATPSVRHLQDVIDRVVSADASLRQEEKPVIVPPPVQAPPVRDYTVKLPPKKAIMEEYQKEAELKLRLERETQQRLMELERHRASPADSDDSGVLNLSKAPEVDSKPAMPVDKAAMPRGMESSAPLGVVKESQQPVDLSQYEGTKGKVEGGERFYPNPFSAILNLSQTYLRKLLNETPTPPHHPDLYSTSAPLKDKENNMDADRYRNTSYNRSHMAPGRDYSPDTAGRLRDMLSSKGIGNGYHSEDSRSSSRNNSRPPSGRSTPVDGPYDRRPLVTSENQADPMGLSDISPLRTNTANMMALKMKLMDHNSLMQPDWKPKSQKKRKNSDISSIEDLVAKEKLLSEGHEPFAKKPRESLQLSENIDNSGKVPNVESVRTGEFPAIAIGKRHICGLCGASFTFQTNLTRHQRKLHGKPFVRKSSLNHPKGSENLSGDERVPLSLVPSPSPTPLTLIKQE